MFKLLVNDASGAEEEALATDLCCAGLDCDTLGLLHYYHHSYCESGR